MFHDPRLSGDTLPAGAGCPQPDQAFTDGEALSAAYSGAGHFRNTPTLANAGYRAAWLNDGRPGTNLNDVAGEALDEFLRRTTTLDTLGIDLPEADCPRREAP